DHRLLVEAELERVRDADDLEDPALDEPVRPGPHRGLADAELRGDLRERPAAVLLEVLDDPLVERRDLVARPRRGKPAPGLCHAASSRHVGEARHETSRIAIPRQRIAWHGTTGRTEFAGPIGA